jgi:hypothetical protein
MIMHLFRPRKYAIYCVDQKKFLSAAADFATAPMLRCGEILPQAQAARASPR